MAEDAKTESQVIIIATVNIQNAKIVSQENNIFNISFDLTNREGAQAGVKYGVELTIQGRNKETI